MDETQAWPSKDVMMSYGHGIVGLFDHTIAQIRARSANNTAYVQGLVASVDADPVLRPLLAALERYGKAGRFYNLDMLADRPQPDMDPAHLWEKAERAALSDPAVAKHQRTAVALMNDNDAWDAFYAAVQSRMADSIEACWQMVSRAGMNNVLGATGGVLGWEVAPNAVGRQ